MKLRISRLPPVRVFEDDAPGLDSVAAFDVELSDDRVLHNVPCFLVDAFFFLDTQPWREDDDVSMTAVRHDMEVFYGRERLPLDLTPGQVILLLKRFFACIKAPFFEALQVFLLQLATTITFDEARQLVACLDRLPETHAGTVAFTMRGFLRLSNRIPDGKRALAKMFAPVIFRWEVSPSGTYLLNQIFVLQVLIENAESIVKGLSRMDKRERAVSVCDDSSDMGKVQEKRKTKSMSSMSFKQALNKVFKSASKFRHGRRPSEAASTSEPVAEPSEAPVPSPHVSAFAQSPAVRFSPFVSSNPESPLPVDSFFDESVYYTAVFSPHVIRTPMRSASISRKLSSVPEDPLHDPVSPCLVPPLPMTPNAQMDSPPPMNSPTLVFTPVIDSPPKEDRRPRASIAFLKSSKLVQRRLSAFEH